MVPRAENPGKLTVLQQVDSVHLVEKYDGWCRSYLGKKVWSRLTFCTYVLVAEKMIMEGGNNYFHVKTTAGDKILDIEQTPDCFTVYFTGTI